jgi:hypothetical protein
MKTKTGALLLTLLFAVASSTAWSEELYEKSLDDEGYFLRVKTAAAVEKSQAELAARNFSMIRPAAKADLDSTQKLYHFVNDLRYKAQLVEESASSRTARYRSARAAQVHFKDLVNVAKSRLAVERSDVNKRFTLTEEVARTSSRVDWALQFYKYAKGMETFDDMEYHQDEIRRTISYAVREHDRAELIYKKATDDSYQSNVASIYRRLNDSVDAYNAYYQSIIDAKAEFNKANSGVLELLGDEWVTDWPTFNYTQPCPADKTPAVAIVVHGRHVAARVKKQSDGSFKFFHEDRDISTVFPDMISRCAAIAVPKSAIATESPAYGGIEHYRRWWMSEGTPRTDEDEIKAIIDLINLAFDALPEARIYLVHGYDGGSLANKVMDRLRNDPNDNIFKIYGHVTVNPRTGEYIGHNLDGTSWSSLDLD